ncbi:MULTISPECIES: universal stress protein [unclassified Streptomyces]|uniref:universal stress protein n=1 Tax=unclassified Streptomyces TaxID=2593676 RepID=UPI000378BBF5|nr:MULTISPECIES: universal stress protein [unclassified Streptomyces]MYX39178.1 universal stress protein [Streptomyces sp. SID8377]
MNEVSEECVVVGVGGSPGGLAALRRAAAEARRRECVLTVVTAWETAWDGAGGTRSRWPPDPPEPDRWRRLARRRMLAALDAAFEGDLPLDPPLRPVLALGRPGPALVEMAGDGAALLVVGAGSHGPWQRLFAPSVAAHCFAHARCPVLAVPSLPSVPPGVSSARGPGRGGGGGRRFGAGRRGPGFVVQ